MPTLSCLKPGALSLALIALGACASDGMSPAPVALTTPAPAPAATSTTTAATTTASTAAVASGATPVTGRNRAGQAQQQGTNLGNRLQFRTEVQQPADFVREGRPANPDYIPVGVTPQRTGVQRSATELQAIEKELDAQRQRSRAFANRPKPASPYDGRPAPRRRPTTSAPSE